MRMASLCEAGHNLQGLLDSKDVGLANKAFPWSAGSVVPQFISSWCCLKIMYYHYCNYFHFWHYCALCTAMYCLLSTVYCRWILLSFSVFVYILFLFHTPYTLLYAVLRF